MFYVFVMSQTLHTIFSILFVKNLVQHGPTGNLIPGPTGIGPRNTPHFVQLIITWTDPRSNGPGDLVQGIHLPI